MLRQFLLLDISLPYAWYVRAQLVCYIAWECCNDVTNKLHRYMIIFAILSIYSLVVIFRGDSLTLCKTIICFLIGIIVYDNLNNVFSIELKRLKVLSVVGSAFSVIIAVLFSKSNSVNNASVMMIFTGAVSIIFVVSVYVFLCVFEKLRLLDTITEKFLFIFNSSYELYLIQGVIQCLFIKTYFCDVVYFEIINPYLSRLLVLIIDLLIAYVFHRIYEKFIRRKLK